MEELTVTIEDRMGLTNQITEYFDEFIPFDERIRRIVWHKITKAGVRNKKKLIRFVMNTFGVSKRRANSIVIEMKGTFNALKELTKEQIWEMKIKVSKIKEKIKADKDKLKQFDKILAKRPLTKTEHKEFKDVKFRIYQKQNKLNRLNQKIKQMQRRVRTGRLKICFGTRKLFKAQYYLKENGFKSHQDWLKAFRANRDKNVFYVGSKDEYGGCQQFQVHYDEETDTFSFKIRKEYPFMKDEKDRYLYIEGIHFNHLRDCFRKAAVQAARGQGDIPLTYRIKKRGKKFYLQAIFRLQGAEPVCRPESRSALGLDFNSGFIAAAEINKDGNLIGTEKHVITGISSGQRKDSLLKTVKRISREAKEKRKAIVAEELKFTTTKAKMVKAYSKSGKEYNKMLSSLEYRRFKEALISRCHKDGVKLIFVDPKDTSKIGKQKYAGKRSLNVHNAAALVIARRGMKFKDKLVK